MTRLRVTIADEATGTVFDEFIVIDDRYTEKSPFMKAMHVSADIVRHINTIFQTEESK